MSEKHEAKRHSNTITVPKDRFDDISHGGRVGAHRLKPRPRVLWKYLVLAVIAFVAFTGVGILALQTVGGSATRQATATEGAAKEKKVVVKVDKTATVAILNASSLSSLADKVGEYITEKELGQVALVDQAAQQAKISAVFYKDEKDANAAMALGEKLGGVSPYLTTEYQNMSARLIVLLGADYNGPGKKAAQQEK